VRKFAEFRLTLEISNASDSTSKHCQ